MIIVDAVSSTEAGSLFVPNYHRGHLSLRSETELTVCLMPPSSDSTIPGMNELVISPIQFDTWQHLVRITALFRDQPGVVRKLANAVARESIDVMYEESATIENGKFHRVEFLASAKIPYERHASNSLPADELLPYLERKFKAICLDELVERAGVLRLKVREMEGLRNAWHAANIFAKEHKLDLSSYAERTIIEKKHIRIPNSILDQLNDRSPRAILISDTKDRILRALIPTKDSFFTYVRVGHLDRIGSFFRIANALSAAFTAVVTLTRLKRQGSQNDVEFLLYSSNFPKEQDELLRREIIESLLADRELQDLFIKVSYPTRAGDLEEMVKRPTFSGPHVFEQPDLVPLENELSSFPVHETLEKRIQTYVKQPKNLNSVEVKKRLGAARVLLAQENIGEVTAPQVFISYPFTQQDLFETVTSVIKSSPDIQIITGQNPDNHGKPFRDEIRKRIRDSQGFLAIWGQDALKSPWLLWELGVAQAFGIPVRILPHKKLKSTPHLNLLPEIHHESFVDVELKDKFSAIWAGFRGEIARFDHAQLSQKASNGDR